jgi:hypothetical protein
VSADLIARLRKEAAEHRESAGKHGEWADVYMRAIWRNSEAQAHQVYISTRNAARCGNKALDLEEAAEALERGPVRCVESLLDYFERYPNAHPELVLREVARRLEVNR